MKEYSTNVRFKAKDGLAATLAVVNDSPLPDEAATNAARDFIDTYNIGFHTSSDELPRELSASYAPLDDERNQLVIRPPRHGHITSVTEKPEVSQDYIIPGKKTDQYIFYNSPETNYAVDIM